MNEVRLRDFGLFPPGAVGHGSAGGGNLAAMGNDRRNP